MVGGLTLVRPDLELAASLFDALSRATRRGRGIVRDSYGSGEQTAHDIMRSAAETPRSRDLDRCHRQPHDDACPDATAAPPA